nr:TIGR02300 family protein [Aminobacter aganoensis]
MTAPQTAVKGTKIEKKRPDVAKSELGTKRIDPETGRKFYDLNKDPIVSPYTGKSYPRSYFDDGKASAMQEEDEEVEAKELDSEEEGAEVVSLEDADEEAKGGGDDLPDLDDDDDVDLGDDDDDTFLADEEEEDDDVSDMIGVGDDEDEI